MNKSINELDFDIIERCNKMLKNSSYLSSYNIKNLMNIGEYNPNKISTLLYIYHNNKISESGKEYFLLNIYSLIPNN